MSKNISKKESTVEILEATFSKSQILNAKNYSDKVDILSTILEDEKMYNIKEVDSLIEKFMKGKVN